MPHRIQQAFFPTYYRAMRERPYYSVRTGKNPSERFDLQSLRKLFISLFGEFQGRGHFQELLGYQCVDEGRVPGTAGSDVESYFLRKLKKPNLWPIQDRKDDLSEDDIFDLVEFLYDYVSKPVDGRYHDFGGCGWHYTAFDRDAGRAEFRSEVNSVLGDYQEGYELSQEGEILTLPGADLAPLLAARLPHPDEPNVEARVAAATRKFRSRHASDADRRDAIRDLADVLEFLRPNLRSVLLSQDEQDLFNIVNNFGIRHHNQRQKVHYNAPVWYSWMFYFFLATIHAAVRLIDEPSNPSPQSK